MDLIKIPMLETERLLLRKCIEEDMDALFAIYRDEDVNTYLPWFPPKSLEEAKFFLKKGSSKHINSPTDMTNCTNWICPCKPWMTVTT